MDVITCPHCLYSFTPAYGQKAPPWCRRCGGDLAARPVGSAEPVEELVSLTAADPAPRPAGSRWGSRPASTPEAAVQTATPTPADTPAPAAGRWAKQRRRGRKHPPADAGWTPDMDRRVEELAARETDTRPPAWWCYAFAGACALIPVISLGGAVPAAIGFGGASACAKFAHSHTLSWPAKLLACLAVTGLCWGLFITLVIVAFKVNQGLAPRRS